MDSDTQDNRVIAATAYLWILCLLPLYVRKKSAFAQHHGKQGFVLFIGSLAFWILGWLPIVGWLFWGIGIPVIGCVSLVGLTHALLGKQWQLPFLGEMAKTLEF